MRASSCGRGGGGAADTTSAALAVAEEVDEQVGEGEENTEPANFAISENAISSECSHEPDESAEDGCGLCASTQTVGASSADVVGHGSPCSDPNDGGKNLKAKQRHEENSTVGLATEEEETGHDEQSPDTGKDIEAGFAISVVDVSDD